MRDLQLTRKDIMTEIRAFIVAVFRDGRGQGIDELSPLVTSGIVDSGGVLQVVDWLENRFHVTIDDADVNLTNFNSLVSLTALVQRKLG
jgi:acyl carrier protein